MDKSRRKPPKRNAHRGPSVKNVDTCSDEAKQSKALLRRLTIQENILTAAVTTTTLDPHLNAFIKDIFSKGAKDCAEINNSLEGITNLFSDFQNNITSPDILRNMEIEEYKRQASELDERIVSLERRLDSELDALRKAEVVLIAQIKDIQEETATANTRKKDDKSKKPSQTNSVKKVCNTSDGPVQKLEQFLRTSGARGGWGEREHALFLSARGRAAGSGGGGGESGGGAGARLRRMLKLLADYVPGITVEDMQAHENWFCEFTRLKAEQKEALDEWRSNKNKLKLKTSSLDLSLENEFDTEEFTNKHERPQSVPKKIIKLRNARNKEKKNSNATEIINSKRK